MAQIDNPVDAYGVVGQYGLFLDERGVAVAPDVSAVGEDGIACSQKGVEVADGIERAFDDEELLLPALYGVVEPVFVVNGEVDNSKTVGECVFVLVYPTKCVLEGHIFDGLEELEHFGILYTFGVGFCAFLDAGLIVCDGGGVFVLEWEKGTFQSGRVVVYVGILRWDSCEDAC